MTKQQKASKRTARKTAKRAQSEKRALILAGGGQKVAFQAGVLQVWLDEAGIEFHHADGASGGLLNLAMWCQGMRGSEIADNWRRYNPLRGIDINWKQLWKLYWAASYFKFDRFRREVLKDWGLDWPKINSCAKEATFNLYNFSQHALEPFPARLMTEDLLISGISLPTWFEPVEVGGDQYIDAVYVTDANLEEAIARGAGELWIIWTISDSGIWRNGLIAHYFQIIEAAGNGPLNVILRRIARNNHMIENGLEGEFGRRIEVRLLKAEVPLHYLFNFKRRKMENAVNLGVEAARAWCREQGIPLTVDHGQQAVSSKPKPTYLEFTEVMKGFIAEGDQDYNRGFEIGQRNQDSIQFRLTIKMDDVEAFVKDPNHAARAEGTLTSERFGGAQKVKNGVFNLFVDQDTPQEKRMLYRLFFVDEKGQRFTLAGFKSIKDDPGFDLWSDTTTLFVKVFPGHIEEEEEEETKSTAIATGRLHIHMQDFLHQLTTFKTKGPTSLAEAKGLAAFGKLFLGSLWDVYADKVF